MPEAPLGGHQTGMQIALNLPYHPDSLEVDWPTTQAQIEALKAAGFMVKLILEARVDSPPPMAPLPPPQIPWNTTSPSAPPYLPPHPPLSPPPPCPPGGSVETVPGCEFKLRGSEEYVLPHLHQG